jgi:hypothetical protein
MPFQLQHQEFHQDNESIPEHYRFRIGPAAPITAGTLAPTVAPTLTASGSGGTLPAATYFVVFSEKNASGETTVSPVSAGQVITLGQDLVIAYPALQPGNVSRNAFAGTSQAGPFTLAASAVTTGTTTISAPITSTSVPQTFNSTGHVTDANGNVMQLVVGGTGSFMRCDLVVGAPATAGEEHPSFATGGSSPAGAPLIVDLLRSTDRAVTFATLFPDPTTRPQLNPGAITQSVGVPGNGVNPGDILRLNVVSTGSGGQNILFTALGFFIED